LPKNFIMVLQDCFFAILAIAQHTSR